MAPECRACARATRLTDGREIYPHSPDLWTNNVYVCDGCGAYVGCHEDSIRPLGTPAGPELRRARILLHEQMIDPLWQTADRCGLYLPEDEQARQTIKTVARSRVYAFLGHRLDLKRAETHVSMFDLQRCRAAWRALQGVTYRDIRDWSHARRKPKAQPEAVAA